jgi:D-alanyl-D-alanine dipeptidase
VSSFRADDAGNFAYLRAGLAARLVHAQQSLPPGLKLLIIEGYRPPALQRLYWPGAGPGLPAGEQPAHPSRWAEAPLPGAAPPEVMPAIVPLFAEQPAVTTAAFWLRASLTRQGR